jgi:glucose-6-phosphate isomerase
MITLDLSQARLKKDLSTYQEKITRITSLIANKTGAGGDFLGWDQWPLSYNKDEFKSIIEASKFIQNNFEVLVVTGIGGSYLGARAVIEAINGLYPKGKKVEIIYLGQTFSPTYTQQVLQYLDNKKFAINVISKSGTTTETAIAFRLLKQLLEKKIGKEAAKKAIFATQLFDSKKSLEPSTTLAELKSLNPDSDDGNAKSIPAPGSGPASGPASGTGPGPAPGHDGLRR